MESHVIGVTVAFMMLALISDGVLTECSAGCTSCSGSTCSSCESSYYLSDGLCSPCPADCNSCNGNDDCTSCRANKWGLESKCLYNCNNNCLNEECQDTNGYCIQCKTGLYGLQCQRNCNLCADELCDLHGCMQGCKPGYYVYKTGIESICQACPPDCKYCNDHRTSHVCNDNFQLFQFPSNGKVFVYCISCSLGSSCSNHCVIPNCIQCQIQNYSLVCTDCPKGQKFNGVTCIPNTISCSQECSSHCDDDGICLGSCNVGWTGERCIDKCSDKCLSCDKSNNDICLQCKGDYYTTNCNVTCNPSCIQDEGKQTCRQNDGYCLNGCEDKYWGNVCDQSCSNGCADIGISLTCDRNNGTCTYGCKEGYTREKCDVTDTSKTTGKPEATTATTATTTTTTQTQISAQCKNKENDCSTNNFIVGFFSGLGACIIVAAITVLFYQIRRRFIARKLTSHREANQTTEMPTYYSNDGEDDASATREPENETNSYERLGRSRNTDQVYSDLETTTVQQSASYYNMGIAN